MVRLLLGSVTLAAEALTASALVLDGRAAGHGTPALLLMLVGLPLGGVLGDRLCRRNGWTARSILQAIIDRRQRAADQHIAGFRRSGLCGTDFERVRVVEAES